MLPIIFIGMPPLGWEDMYAYVAAAKGEILPIILKADPGCHARIALTVLGMMFVYLAERASVPVDAHLHYGYGLDEFREALEYGLTIYYL